MKFSTFSMLVKKLKSLDEARMEYLDTIPNDINSFITDNVFSNTTGQMFDLVFDELFGDLSQDVSYFLYDSYPQKIEVDGKKYVIRNVHDYLEYARDNLDFEQE